MGEKKINAGGAEDKGVSLMETLVVMGLVTSLFGATLASFFSTSRHSYDHQVITQAQDQAKAILDMMAFDMRMAGAGVPLGQTNFTITDVTLDDAPLAILDDATASEITLRLNEKGVSTVLTADFTPGVVNWFSVFDASDFEIGDAAFINNMTAGGDDGLGGLITNVAGNTITVDASYYTNAGSAFATGSLVERVSNVQYVSALDWSGITREVGFDPDIDANEVVLAPNSTFSIAYFDDTGTEMVLPLTGVMIEDDLTSLVLTVNVRGRQALKDGTIYTAAAEQSIGLRNMNVSR